MLSPWNRKSRRMLMERMEMYASAGLPIGTVILQAGQGLPRRQQASIANVRSRVESGQAISVSFDHELGFPPSVVGIVSCGEASGSLSQAFKRGHALLEREDMLIKKCTSALAYPCVIALAAAALTLGLVRGIMPQITPLLTSMDADLPVLTKIVMKLSDLVALHGIWAGIGIIVAAAGATLMYRKISPVRAAVHECLMRIPLCGGLIKRYALAVFFQSMGALTESGMPADKAYEQSISAISLIPLKKKLAGTVHAIADGGSFGAAFAKGMPSYIAPLVAAGEASGTLASSFVRAADILDRELDHSLKSMTALIEPVMMILMGCTVGAIALSIMMPIYDISKTLQH